MGARPFRSATRCHASFALAFALVAGQAPVTTAAAQIPAAEFAARRDSLAARIGDGVVIAFGGRTPVTDFGPFYQNPAFRYLTNFDEPDAAMLMVVRGGRGATTLFRSSHDGWRIRRRESAPRQWSPAPGW